MPLTGLSNRGSLTINSVNLRNTNGAFWVLDYMPLFGFPESRGDNVLIPSATGKVAYPRIINETTYTLDMLIATDVGSTGTTYTAPVEGLRANVVYLKSNVCGPWSGSATYSATLVDDNSHSYTASVQTDIELGTFISRTKVRALLHVTIPAGTFA